MLGDRIFSTWMSFRGKINSQVFYRTWALLEVYSTARLPLDLDSDFDSVVDIGQYDLVMTRLVRIIDIIWAIEIDHGAYAHEDIDNIFYAYALFCRSA